MQAADIMTAHPISVTPEATIAEAARLMLQHHISGLPVTDGAGAVVGMLTEGDLLRRAETGTERHRARWLELLLGPGRLARDYVETHARKVGEAMSGDVLAVAPGDALETVVELMQKRRVKRLPVIEDGKLVGIVSRADLVHALLDALTRESTGTSKPASDEELRERIRAIVDNEPWGPRFSIEITVKDRVAHLNGTVTDDRERTAVTVAAENVPGVKAVRDHLVWVEPTTGLVLPPADERD
jgi:CBS domain-containing protein